MNSFPCINPDLKPGRLNGRRYSLELEFYGCDLSGYDSSNSDTLDDLPEYTVYTDNDVEIRGGWIDLPNYKSFVTGGEDRLILAMRKMLLLLNDRCRSIQKSDL